MSLFPPPAASRLRIVHSRPTTQHTFSRRSFLAFVGAVPALLAARRFPREEAGSRHTIRSASHPIGIELYSVRNELARDLPATLRAISRIGYPVVEFYAPYFDWTFSHAKEVRSLMDDLGLRCHSTHNAFPALSPGTTMAKAIELNQILGSRYIILASPPDGTRSGDDWKRLAARLTTALDELRPHGLLAGYHNHDAEWAELPGSDQRILEFLAANTPDDFALQLDVGTCMEAGADPVAWIRSHPGRIRSVHLKDWAPPTASGNGGYRVLFGEGIAPWKDIIAALESTGGVEYYLMEQEGSRFSELETAARCLDSWKKLRGPS